MGVEKTSKERPTILSTDYDPDRIDSVEGQGQAALITKVNQKSSEIPSINAANRMQIVGDNQATAKITLVGHLHSDLGLRVRESFGKLVSNITSDTTGYIHLECPKGTRTVYIGGDGKLCSEIELLTAHDYAVKIAKQLGELTNDRQAAAKLWDQGSLTTQTTVIELNKQEVANSMVCHPQVADVQCVKE